MNTHSELIKQANLFLDQGCLVSAEKKLKEAASTVTENLKRAFIAYQIGALHWGSSGNGEKAREYFLLTVKLWNECSESSRKSFDAPIYANACENLMILSLSFEEYFEWAERLETIAPQEPILHQHRPEVRRVFESGQPWSAVMMGFSDLYVSPDPTIDPGRYSSACCILRLLLKNRKLLRLSRHDWRMAAIGYGAVAMLATGHCDKVMREKTGRTDPLEYIFIVEQAIPLVEEYVDANPNDPQAHKTLEGLRGSFVFVANLTKSETSPRETIVSLKPKLLILIAPFFWFLLFLGAMFYLPKPWNVVLGIPVFIMFIITVTTFLKVFSRRTSREPRKIHGWRFSSELKHEIRKQELSGLRFRCLGAESAIDGSIEIMFESLTYIIEEKREAIHLTLRCIVGLTFPEVVACVPECRIVTNRGIKYTVRLGNGIQIPAYFIHTPIERIGPLQVTSEEYEGRYYVYIKPMVIQSDMPGRGSGVLAEIALAFDHWKSLSLDFR